MGDDLRAALHALVDEVLEKRVEGSGLRIHGVEVTQATQHFDSANRIDNSIRLVAYKPAYVRVYVRNRGGPPLGGVTGTVTLQWPHLRFDIYKRTLRQLFPPSVTAEAAPNNERGPLLSSLNFIIPAAEMRGPMRLKIRIEVPGSEHHDEMELNIDASLLQTLRVRGIPLAFKVPALRRALGKNLPALDLAAPTLAAFQQTAALALALFPVEQTPVIGLTAAKTVNFRINDVGLTPGQCSASWVEILAMIKEIRDQDGNHPGYLYYGMLPLGTPMGSNTGCEANGFG
jgi:hypothetical protein